MQTVTLNNGITMPLLGFGVYQAEPKDAKRRCWPRLKRATFHRYGRSLHERGGRRPGSEKSGIPAKNFYHHEALDSGRRL